MEKKKELVKIEMDLGVSRTLELIWKPLSPIMNQGDFLEHLFSKLMQKQQKSSSHQKSY